MDMGKPAWLLGLFKHVGNTTKFNGPNHIFHSFSTWNLSDFGVSFRWTFGRMMLFFFQQWLYAFFCSVTFGISPFSSDQFRFSSRSWAFPIAMLNHQPTIGEKNNINAIWGDTSPTDSILELMMMWICRSFPSAMQSAVKFEHSRSTSF